MSSEQGPRAAGMRASANAAGRRHQDTGMTNNFWKAAA